MKTRQILVTVVGHVDHGKSSLLDKIRGTAIVEKEAGMITQAIGASIIPIETIKRVCGKLLDQLKTDITIPGILAIDTPGHAAFTSLRKRGGSLADIAIVVVDVNEGFKPQTEEAIEILKNSKTPFIIAANKIDLISGWKPGKGNILGTIKEQSADVQKKFEGQMYTLVSQIYEKFKLNAERFDRVEDYTKQVAIVPTSAKTGEGIAELLMVLTGLAQRFLEKGLECDIEGPAKATILEVKEEKGLGKTLDVIIYDGHLNVNDQIVIGGLQKPIVTKVKALLEPAPLSEMRDKSSKFKSVKEVTAATGVKISAPDIDDAVAGMPLLGVDGQSIKKLKQEVQEQVEEVIIETEKEGVVLKADTLGSLEAMTNILKEKNIPIRKAMIGDITKKDVIDAKSSLEKNPLYAAVIGFNVRALPESKSDDVKIINKDIIYEILDELENWQKEQQKKIESRALEGLTKPCKIEILKGYVFRQNNPAVVGVEVAFGTLKSGMPVMNQNGEHISEIKSIQQEQESITGAEKGKQVAVSLPGVTVGRQIKEEDNLYSFITEQEFRKYKDHKDLLSGDEKAVLKEIAGIMRKKNPLWGV